jgi:hypothetical protein
MIRRHDLKMTFECKYEYTWTQLELAFPENESGSLGLSPDYSKFSNGFFWMKFFQRIFLDEIFPTDFFG